MFRVGTNPEHARPPEDPVNRSHQPAEAPRRAIGYSRVSTGQQVESGLGMDAQQAAIEA